MSSDGGESPIEMGGYFGLDLPDYGDPFPDTFKFQSGRAALRAVIEAAGIERVLLPAYICDSVIRAVVDSGAVTETYFLDSSLYPKNLPSSFPEKCVFLYVNYFGLCQKNVNRLLQEIPSKNLIIDNSQALFAQPSSALATIYSIRKFVGVPDGGLLVTPTVEIKEQLAEDTNSIGRMRHLLLRMAYPAQNGYADYIEAERSLDSNKPLKMSRLTKRLLSGIDMVKVKQKRRENFLSLAAQLDTYGTHKWELDAESVPLCYPLIVDWNVECLKNSLVEKGIYIPTYWLDAKPRVLHNSIEYCLTTRCLAVPCDQRYSSFQISHLANEVSFGVKKKRQGFS